MLTSGPFNSTGQMFNKNSFLVVIFFFMRNVSILSDSKSTLFLSGDP